MKMTKELLEHIIIFSKQYDYIFDKPEFGFLVSHPLTDSILKFSTIKKEDGSSNLNLALEKDRDSFYEDIKKDFLNKDLGRFFFMVINKPYKITMLRVIVDFLIKNKQDIDLDIIILLYLDSYKSIEFPYQCKHDVLYFYNFLKNINLDKFLYHKLDIEEGDTIYRGQDKKEHTYISWTTNIDVAKKFANRFSKDIGVILETKVKKEDIWYTCGNREEFEIVLKPTVIFSELNIKEILD